MTRDAWKIEHLRCDHTVLTVIPPLVQIKPDSRVLVTGMTVGAGYKFAHS